MSFAMIPVAITIEDRNFGRHGTRPGIDWASYRLKEVLSNIEERP